MKHEVRAVWFPFMEFQEILTGKSRNDFKDEVKRRFALAAGSDINRLFVHVRPFGDALYHSNIFPTSHLITGEEGVNPPFDPLEIMIEVAHELEMELDAWVNPFRIRAPGMTAVSAELCAKNPALHMKDDKGVIAYRNGLTYNPASEEACTIIIEGLRELCLRYPVDGVHFDDYFYPSADPYFDMDSYCAYKLSGGGLSQAAWRKQNVSLFLKRCYLTVHNSKCGRFGVSPKGFMDCNLFEEFLDVPQILASEGYVDYICPQVYFSISDEICPFDSVIKQYDKLIKANIELIAGLAVYKIGRPDPHAGAGSKEWERGEAVLANMVQYSKNARHYCGYSLYHFQAAFQPKQEYAVRIDWELRALKALTVR